MLLDIQDVSISFSERTLFQHVSLRIEEGDRIGLVGANGEGKTSLLNLLNGDLSPTTGIRTIKKDLHIGYLRQNSGLESKNTIREEMKRVFEPLLRAQARMQVISHQLENYHTEQQKKQQSYQVLAAEYGELLSYFESNEGYQIDVKIETILNGMGFREFDKETICATLSGGEKTRLALAKLLLQQPDLLMLDEPTNHLDMETLQWLEGYLSTYKGALIIVSHDRYFLDQICNRIWELANLSVTPYKGNYTKYQQTHKLLQDYQVKEYQKQQIEVQKLSDYIARNKVRATTAAMAKSREKALEKLKQQMKRPPTEKKSIRIHFQYPQEPVKDVLQVEQLPLFAGGDPFGNRLIPPMNFTISRGDKVAIVGPNGVGKTTLLKTLIRDYPLPQGARIRWGLHTKLAYYSQDFSSLTPYKTLKEEIWDRIPLSHETEVRNLLANVGFIGEDVDKNIDMLSGGEKSRMKLAILMLEKANVLLMDEPTNHLDLSSREVLEEALINFSGTLLLVSHDRYLLSKVPNKIIELSPQGLQWYEGGYQSYLSIKTMQTIQEYSSDIPSHLPASEGAKEYYRTKQQRAQDAMNRRRLQQLENEIPKLEEHLKELSIEMGRVAGDYTVYCEVAKEYEEGQNQLNDLMAEWTELSERYENLS